MGIVWRPEKKGSRKISRGVFGDLDVGGAKNTAGDGVDVEAVGGFLGGIFEDVGDLGAIRTESSISCLIKSQGRGGGDDGEETSIGGSDKLRFDGKCLGPRVKSIFFNLDIVCSWGEIELVVGDRGELVVDRDSGGLGIGSDIEETCACERSFGEVWAIAFGKLDGHERACDEEKDN